jgi:hypothetical protein
MLLLSSCSSIRESSKYQFSEGIYRVDFRNAQAKKVYVDIFADSLVMYPYKLADGTVSPDTSHGVSLAIPEERSEELREVYSFSKPSFDLDVLTIPFKFRPAAGEIPSQLNTSFQGAIYLGRRRDFFRIRYKPTPLGNYKRSFNHFGYSLGIFSGLGGTLMNESVTGGLIAYEYDGVVLLNGVAGILGINNFTIGLSLGIDHLLDRNREFWLYQNKPWIGLAFGLNLN